MRLFAILCVLTSAPNFASGQENKANAPPGPVAVITLARKEPVSYEKDIEPILMEKCQVCHSGTAKKGRLDISTYDLLLRGGKRGKPIVPGKASQSLLVKFVGRTQLPIMPPRGEEPVTPQELALLKLWIDQGALGPKASRAPSRAGPVLQPLPALVHPVRAMVISPDAATLAVGRGNQIHLYDARSGAYLRRLADPVLGVPAAHRSIVESLAYSPDGTLLASGSFQEVLLWEAKSGMLKRRLQGFADRVMSLSFSHDGKLLATGGGAPTEEGEIKILDVATGKLLADIKNAHSDTVFGVSFSPDGSKLASCSADKFVKVFEMPGGKLLKAFEGHTHHVLDVAWRADGKVLASAGADNVIKVWDYDKGEQVRTLGNYAKQITRLAFKGKTSEVLACSGDQTIRFWNVDTGSAGLSFGGSRDYLYAVAVSPDSKMVAAGGEEGVVRIYDGANGRLVQTLMPPVTEQAVKPTAK